jgi:hypothetical protein
METELSLATQQAFNLLAPHVSVLYRIQNGEKKGLFSKQKQHCS